MSGTERVGNLGYIAFATETTKGTAVTPTVFAFLDNETLTTQYNLENQTPVAGTPFETFQVLPGMRDHKGDIEIVAEPNTALQLHDMMMTRGSSQTFYTFTVTSANATIGATYTSNGATFTVTATIAASTTLICTGTGAPLASGTLTKSTGTGDASITFSANVVGPIQWPFTINGNSLPKSKTVDVSLGNVVKRFVGVEASKITPNFQKNQLNLKATVSALASFQGAVISSISGSGPYTINLDTTYDSNPTSKLVVGDLVRFFKVATSASVADATIASIVSAGTVTVTLNTGSMAAIGVGDVMHLRPATANYTVVAPFLWTNTQFCFGTTAALALVAAQTRLEQSSAWELDYSFESDSGSQRSGSADPASLVRTTAKSALNIKKFFDTPEDVVNFNNQVKTASVIRHFAYVGSTTYELRVTFNSLKTEDPLPKVKTKSVNYAQIKYHTQYDQTDGQEFDVKVIASVSSIG